MPSSLGTREPPAHREGEIGSTPKTRQTLLTTANHRPPSCLLTTAPQAAVTRKVFSGHLPRQSSLVPVLVHFLLLQQNTMGLVVDREIKSHYFIWLTVLTAGKSKSMVPVSGKGHPMMEGWKVEVSM